MSMYRWAWIAVGGVACSEEKGRDSGDLGGEPAGDTDDEVGDSGCDVEVDADTGQNLCAVAMPETTQVVSGTSDLDESGVYWVCSGAVVTISGGDTMAFVESGGVATIRGYDTSVWALNGSRVTVDDPDADDIWLTHEPCATVDVRAAEDALLIACPAIALDSSAVTGGC